MKTCFIIVILFLSACNDIGHKENSSDTSIVARDEVHDSDRPTSNHGDQINIEPEQKVFANQRFRNVTITSLQGAKYAIEGEAQIFEASFNWVIEDGHNELDSGYATTSAGAPEWGKFRFEILAKKRESNSTLTLILYEASAQDGSRQHLLPIPIPN